MPHVEVPSAGKATSLTRSLLSVVGVPLVCSLVACSSPSGPGTTVTAGRAAGPANDTSVPYYNQPVTLTITTGVATGGVSPTTTVEVATDASFASIVATQVLAASANGQATVVLDHLTPATTYYWRVKTTAGDNPGSFTAAVRFTVGPMLVVQPPTPVQPLATTFPHKRPTFVVTNASHSGPPATLTYRFDVATDASFATIVATGTVPEGSGQTSFTPSVDLVPGTSYVWRSQASDAGKNVASGYSNAQPFATVFPEDGATRYTLLVHTPSSCLTQHSVSNGGFNGQSFDMGWIQSDLSYDGTLTMAGDAGQYATGEAGEGLIPFQNKPVTLNFIRAGNGLTGTLYGSSPGFGLRTNAGAFVTSIFFVNDVVAGTPDNQGRFSGTFSDGMGLWKFGFPGDATAECSSNFGWTLTPH